MGAGMMGAGIATSIAGGALSMIAAEDRRDRANQIKAKYQPIDISAITGNTIAGNLGNLAAASELGKKVDVAAQTEWDRALKASMPEYAQIRKEQLSNIQSMTDIGRLLADAQRGGAAFGVSSGTLGSGFNKAFTTRQFGWDYNKAMQAQTSALEGYLQSSAKMQRAPTFDITSMFVTPAQGIAEANYNQNFQASMDFAILGMPTGTDAAASSLTSFGGAALGGGGGQPIPQQQKTWNPPQHFWDEGQGGGGSGPGGTVETGSMGTGEGW